LWQNIYGFYGSFADIKKDIEDENNWSFATACCF